MSDKNGGGARRTKFLTVPEVAAELGISERSVWRLIEEGELPAHRFGASTRIRREDLDSYIDRSRRERPKRRDDDEDETDGPDDDPTGTA